MIIIFILCIRVCIKTYEAQIEIYLLYVYE